MKKIKITKSFPLNKVGQLKVGQEIELNDSTADYCVKKMKSATYIKAKKAAKKEEKVK